MRANGDARQVDLVVADRGSGLPEGFDETWFEPYRTSKPRGTGLGLCISKEIMERHGGNIYAESEEKKGSTFTFLLPLKQQPSLGEA